MKITIVGPVYPYRGGIAHHTAFLSQALERAGHNTQIISFRRQYLNFLYPGTSDKDPSQNTLDLKAEYLLDPIYPWTWLEATNSIKAYRPDLIIIQWWTTFWGLQFACLSRNLLNANSKIVYLIHNVIPHEQKPWDEWITKLALNQGTAFIVQTNKEKARLNRLIPEAKTNLCPIPVYKFYPKQGISKTGARRRLSLPVNDTVLLFFGIIRPYKGLHNLLEALGQLRLQGIYPRLLVAGEFWAGKDIYLRQIETLNISDQVQIQDRYIPNEELETIFAAADVLAAPYTGGTQSAVVGMALGFGLPIIVSEDIGKGITKTNQNSVITFPVGDIPALVKCIKYFVNNQDNIIRSSQPAKDDWDRLVTTIEDLAN